MRGQFLTREQVLERRDIPKALIALAAARPASSLARAVEVAPTMVNPRDHGGVGDGVADDSAAIEAALASGSNERVAVVLPMDATFRITRYIEIPGNTTMLLLGKVRLVDRSAGFFTNGGANVSIIGFSVGQIADEAVHQDYGFNTYRAGMAPAIHIRSTRNVSIEGVNISYCRQGILISNAAETVLVPGRVHLTQPRPDNCRVTDCDIRFCEMSGIASFNALDSRYVGNSVYRCGDGGMWMMGAKDCEVIGNRRISPYSVPGDVAAYGPNDPAHPTTWNDEQGIEFENCHGVRVADNLVKGFWAFGIDVKNGCDRLVVAGNRVEDCENASICVRDGDGVKNACHKIAITGNTVSGHGTAHYDRPTAQRGAIRTGECFVADVRDNVIYGYRRTPGIVCEGPGAYQRRWYARNPHQGSLDASGNRIEFKNAAFELEQEPQFDSQTLAAIVIRGQYDSVRCADNTITTDRYLSIDARTCAAAAISLTYLSANGSFYPTSAAVTGNQIGGWGNWGIAVAGLPQMKCSGLVVSGNSLGAIAGGGGIRLANTNRPVCSYNMINQIVAGSGYAGILLEGSSEEALEGAVAIGNQITGGWDAGGNAMTYGLRLDYCGNCDASHNSVGLASIDAVGVFNARGPIVLSGTTGFPRSGVGSPNGRLAALYPGELYLDDSDGSCWLGAAAGGNQWTPLPPPIRAPAPRT